jgi:hypothetical protein
MGSKPGPKARQTLDVKCAVGIVPTAGLIVSVYFLIVTCAKHDPLTFGTCACV